MSRVVFIGGAGARPPILTFLQALSRLLISLAPGWSKKLGHETGIFSDLVLHCTYSYVECPPNIGGEIGGHSPPIVGNLPPINTTLGDPAAIAMDA